MSNEIDTSPTPASEPKKINRKLVAAAVLGVFAVIGWFMVPSSDTNHKKPVDNKPKNISTDKGVVRDVSEAEGKKSDKLADSLVVNGGVDNATANGQSTSSGSGQGNVSANQSVATTTSQPAPIEMTEVEKYYKKKELEDIMRQDAKEVARENKAETALSSDIFVKIEKPTTLQKEEKQQVVKVKNANEYYNATNAQDKRYVGGDGK